jgi:hypothetical protein
MNEPEWQQYLQQFTLDRIDIADKLANIPPVGKTSKFCLIVEPRDHPLLLLVLRNFMYLLQPKGWGLIIFHGRNNEQVLQQEIAKWTPNSISPVVLHKMDVDNLTINDYSNLLCCADFWRILRSKWGCEHALIFQTDTVLLLDNVDDFLQYHYVGSPFFTPYINGTTPVGNGGLSLRNCIAMEKIASKCSRFIYLPYQYNRTSWNNKYRFHLLNEDVFFSYWLYKYREPYFRLPTVNVAMRFSVESIYFDAPCGMHNPNISVFADRATFASMFPLYNLHTSNNYKECDI